MRGRAGVWAFSLWAVLSVHPAAAQDAQTAGDQCNQAKSQTKMVDMNPAAMFLMDLASGTSQNPASWPMPMMMTHLGKWNLMFMGNAFLSDIQQSGPRGGDKLYSTNWFMASAEHRVGASGAFEAVLMLSLEPATITDRRYPLLFQTGETAYGVPLVDAQHPHNFIMALGFHYARRLAPGTTLDLYFAPVGDPALGPVAFPHRASAMEFPQAPISHHWQDSTHIADDVVTAGVRYRQFKLEASGFHGAEPGENRWTIQQGAIDSWSSRLWFFPSANWAAQVSVGQSRSSGSAGARGPDPHHRIDGIYAPRTRRQLGFEPDLGAHPQHRDAAQPECVSGRIRPASHPQQSPYGPRRNGCQG